LWGIKNDGLSEQGGTELAKDAQPAYLGDVYRKVAVRYVFMAEELLKGPGRNGDAIERADRMISRLRPDPASVSKVKRNACEVTAIRSLNEF
jgi:hypothetical protein